MKTQRIIVLTVFSVLTAGIIASGLFPFNANAAEPTAFGTGPTAWARNARIGGLSVNKDMTLAKLNQLMATMKNQNVTVVEADFEEGLSNYRTEEEFDLFLAPMQKLAAAAHDNGLKVVVYYASLEVLTPNGVNLEDTMAKTHPDWVQWGWNPYADDTSPMANVAYGGTPTTPWVENDMEDAWMSPSSPYRDYYYARVKKIAGTGIDGLWVDVPLYTAWGTTFWNDISEFAKNKFTSDTGKNPPTRENWNNLAWRRWIAWRHKELSRFIAGVATAARTEPDRSEFAIIVETLPTDYNGATVWGLEGSDLRSIEGVMSVWEVSTLSVNTSMRNAREDDWISYISIQKYIKAASGAKPAWSFAYAKQADDAELVAGEVLAARNNVYEVLQPYMTETVGAAYRTKMFGWVKANEPYLSNTVPAARVALLYSPASRDYVDKFSGLGQFATTDAEGDDLWWSDAPEDSAYQRQYVAEFRGMVKLLVHNHIPFEVVVNPASSAELAKYQSLIMPDWEAASTAEVQIIKDYVNNGGHIIATGPNPSGWDEYGTSRPEYALSDVLGISKNTLPPPIVSIIQRTQTYGFGEARYFSEMLGKKYFTNAVDAPSAAASLLEAINATSTPWLTTDANKKVHMELSQTGNKLILHHVNFIGTDGTFSVENTSVTTTLNIPTGKEVATIEVTSPDNATHALSPLAYSKNGQDVTFTVPIKEYSLVVVSLADFITDASSLNVPEGGTATFNVKLSFQPASDVTVNVARTSGDADISVSLGSNLIFNAGNWNIDQVVTLAAVEDADTTNGNATITCSGPGLTSKTISATEIDNDWILIMATDGKGTTVPSGTAIVKKNTATDITAVATEYPFVNWMISGDATIANVNSANTTATLTGNAAITAIFRKPILSGIEISAISGIAGNRREYKITVPAIPSQTLLEVKTYGGTGDVDLTVSGLVNGEQKVMRGSGATSNENLQIENPTGDYIISLNAKSDYAGLSLMAKYSNANPLPPTAVIASQGIYHDAILVTWKVSSGATKYLIYRDVSKIIPPVSIAETSDTSFFDNDAGLQAGKPYYYWIKAKNTAVSAQSAMASGNISNAPVAPETIMASDGAYFDKIRVTWPKVPGATSYLIYRTESVNQPQDLNAFVAKTTALYYDDFDGSKYPRNNDGTVKKYWYWIAAKNHDIASAINKFNDGYLSSRGPITVTASTTYADGIVVSWMAVPGAISYDVYRDTVSKFTPAAVKVVSSSEALAYKDTSPVTGNYYYRVKAKYGSYESDFSAIAAMGRLGLLLSPSDVTPLDNGATSSESGLREKGSYKYFSTNVPMGSTRLIATLCGTTSALTNDCNLFAKFANFPTVSSYNAKGVENKDNEILTVGNPAPGMWYFLLFGITAYDKVTLTVNCYSVADIVLTQVPVNDMSVPFTAVFKGKVVDEAGVGIAGLSIQVRNPITGTTSWLPAKTDAKGLFAYSTVINTEGEYTFDFFFTAMPDTAKGTASHTVWTHKGFSVAEPNNFFDRSSYLPATQFPLVQANVFGLQNFLSTRNGWDEDPIVPADEMLWINSTLVKAKDDMQLLGKLDDGLYMFFYGVEGAGVGNDLTATSVFSAVPFVVHVASGKLGAVLANLTNLIDPAVAANVTNVNGGIGIVAVTAVNNPNEATEGCNISLSASEQLELLANIAGKTWELSDITNVSYSGVAAKKVTITLANDRQINVIASSFVK